MKSYLAEHNTGTYRDIVRVKNFLNVHRDDMREFYTGLITKTLKLGCDAKIVNSVIPNLIPTFDVMLGTSIDKVKLKPNEKIFISQKLNGSRCLYYNGIFYTRQGREYTGLNHIKSEIEQYVKQGIVLDGELIRKNIDNKTDSENFQLGVGIANSKAEDKTELKFVVFDTVTNEEFERGYSDKPYSERKKQLLELQNIFDCCFHLEIVKFVYEGTDHNEIWKALDRAESMDWEGVVVNTDSPYVCKRTKELIKVKRFYTFDLKVVGYEEGFGKLKGTLGALVVDYKGNTVNVGSGFDDKTRAELWNMRNELIDRVIEVKYKEITKDKKTGKESLQFPVFCGLRELGKEISYN